jgi:EpsI family protein
VAYRSGPAAVTEFVALYRLPERGSPLTRAGAGVVRPEPWRLVETGRAAASFGGSSVVVNTAKIAREGQQRQVWWFYVIDGQPTGSVVEAKFRQAIAGLRGGPHLGALIAIATDVADDRPDAPILPSFLEAVHPTPGAADLSRG